MENKKCPRIDFPARDEQLVSQTSLGSNSKKKADAASGNQTEEYTVEVQQYQNIRKRKISGSYCDPGMELFSCCCLLAQLKGEVICKILQRYFIRQGFLLFELLS